MAGLATMQLITKFNTLIAFCALYSLSSSILAYSGEWTSDRTGTDLFYTFSTNFLIAWWVKDDMSQKRFYGPYEFPAFVFFWKAGGFSLLFDQNPGWKRNPEYGRFFYFDHGALFTCRDHLFCILGNVIILFSFNLQNHVPITHRISGPEV